MIRILLILFTLTMLTNTINAQTKPLKVGVAGLTHGHVHWILGREDRGDIEIVGISEPNKALVEKFMSQYDFDKDLVFDDLETMLIEKKPEAVTAFGTTFEHLEVVKACAPKGIHVMVEKPLAVNMAQASEMQQLAMKYDIHLLTNYETTWYPTTHAAIDFLKKNEIGSLTQVIVRDGHRGPEKIGVGKEFLEWLTDPELNGGGALMDFGCYGVNIMTWFMQNERPIAVTAVTQTLQPKYHPNVEDEATIILSYKNAKATVQASWNWPIGRKDMEVYGETGAIFVDNGNELRIRYAEGYDGYDEKKYNYGSRKAPLDDPFAYFASVVQGEIKPGPYDLSALPNNMIVMEILDAARKSAETGQTVYLDK
ncbi:MAG TPA: oxidoreductase [Cytophagales bacterium]|jgi:predicted dehydrogenase|nr:oxidoreductase [Cytophagales bacterium]